MKGTDGNGMASLCAGALQDSADPVSFVTNTTYSVILSFNFLMEKGWNSFVVMQLILLFQSKETFRAIIRSDIGETLPFSTLQNRSQIYKKLTGRKLAKAQLNLQRYAVMNSSKARNVFRIWLPIDIYPSP
jgi:hypothetical protein